MRAASPFPVFGRSQPVRGGGAARAGRRFVHGDSGLRHGIVFLLLSAVCAAGVPEVAAPAVRLLLVNLAACWLLVGVAFLTRRPSLFGKRPDGGLPVLSYLLFWPYLALSELSLLALSLSREPAGHVVAPGLVLSRRPCSFMPGAAGRFHRVLDVTCELPEVRALRTAASYRCIPVLDASAPSPEQLEAGVRFLLDAPAGEVALVHCALGHGRSAVFAAAYLLTTGGAATPEEAEERLRREIGFARERQTVAAYWRRGASGDQVAEAE